MATTTKTITVVQTAPVKKTIRMNTKQFNELFTEVKRKKFAAGRQVRVRADGKVLKFKAPEKATSKKVAA